MATPTLTLDDLVAAARQLSPRDRLRLIERLAAEVGPALPSDPPQPVATAAPPEGAAEAAPKGSLYGILAGVGPVPSEEDITEMRREAWKN